MRINKYIASTGLCSRRKADELITAGKVRVNDVVVTALGVRVDPEKDRVSVEGTQVQPTLSHRYYKYYKQRGEVSSNRAQSDSLTVFQAIGRQGINSRGLKLIGRLDKESEGLVLLTSDNSLVEAIAHPRRKVPKIYRVTILGQLLANDLSKIRHGVRDEDEKLAVDALEIVSFRDGVTEVACTLHEGKKRHLRRIFRQLHKFVRKLKRTHIGEIQLGDLEPGLVKPLSAIELKYIRGISR